MTNFDIFLVSVPGLEGALCDEAREKGFKDAKLVAGGVKAQGGWPEAWRANLELRGPSRVLARIGSFHAAHLAQLDKRARKFPWGEFLRADVAVHVEASCVKSRIYHSGAAAQRIAIAIKEELGAPIDDAAQIIIKARIEDDLCTLSIDTSGEMLHKRGHKQAMAKAPMRETMAALFLRECGFTGQEPVVDPLCGSGTFVIEAAEIAAGLMPGRSRNFAFEQLATFNQQVWDAMRAAAKPSRPAFTFHGYDRDAGAITSARANATRAGVADFTAFKKQSLSNLTPPDGPPGLVIMNPPYGARIGDKKELHALYGAIGKTLSTRFQGWRVGLITADAVLAKATGLPFVPQGRSVLHGGTKVHLFRTAAGLDLPGARRQ
jgi:putative N6-adenine-specific DNA methylase